MAHSSTDSSYSEELRPIRIGAIAQQPAADRDAVLYVGLASYLPEGLRYLCICAGLFFGRFVCHDEDSVRLEVAALAHYFDASDSSYYRHVRSIIIPASVFAKLLEYDRSLAGRATYDVREMMEEHALCVTREQNRSALVSESHLPDVAPILLASPAEDTSVRIDASTAYQDVAALAPVLLVEHRQKHPSKLKFEQTAVIIPLERVRELTHYGSPYRHIERQEDGTTRIGGLKYRVSRSRLNMQLLHVAIDHLREERDAVADRNEKSALHDTEARLRHVLRMREVVSPRVELLPIYAHGSSGNLEGCRLDIIVPIFRAA